MFAIEQSVLVVVDIQGKLASLVYDREITIKNQQNLIRAAQILDIPILWTEQVPEKVGDTITEIKSLLAGMEPIEKISFSCVPNKKFLQALLNLNRKQIILCGIEAHVCIFQTCVDLIGNSFQVQVVVDAVSSRTKLNKDIALERMKAAGAELTSTEMMITELIRTAEHKKFREIIHLIK